MQLNLPILDHLTGADTILIAGAGGGHDILAGLPLYFTLREQGKTVFLANFSFTFFERVRLVAETDALAADGKIIDGVLGARPPDTDKVLYYPEGYLSQWFRDVRGEDVTVWMFRKSGAAPLIEHYAALVQHLQPDALILVDGGVDSIMRGDESGPGTLIEDTLSLIAACETGVQIKLLACLGFGTEVEENVCHYHALENIAALAKMGGFLGSCALTPQMDAFQQFEAACRYIWEDCKNPRSHITTRVIPAVRGEFGDYPMYPDDTENTTVPILVSPLMSLYWFFDADKVIERSLIADQLRHTHDVVEAVIAYRALMMGRSMRPRRRLSY